VWARLGDPNAISWVTGAVVVVLQVCGSLLTSLVDYSDRFLLFLALRLIALVALCVVLAVGKWMLVHTARAGARPVIALVTFISAVAVGTAVFDTLLVAADFTDEQVFWRRFGVSVLGIVTAMVVTAVLVGSARDIARDNLALSETVAHLGDARANAGRRIAERYEQLVHTIETDVRAVVGPLETAGAAVTVEQMSALLDDVVRPLSLQLAREIESADVVASAPPSTRIPWSVAAGRALATSPFPRLAPSIWLAVITASFFVGAAGTRGAIGTVALFVVNLVLTGAARRVWPLIPARVPPIARVVIYLLALIPAWFASAVVLQTITGLELLTPILLAAWAVLYTVVASAVALVTSVGVMQHEVRTDLQHAAAELRREIVSLNSVYRQRQKAIARVLHGPVQEAVSVAIHRLGASPTADLDPSVTADLRRRLSEALDLMRTPQVAGINLAATIADLRDLWSEVVDIRFVATAHDRILIGHDIVANNALVELIREASGNAIRHARAEVIAIGVTVSRAGRLIYLRVENDGAPLATLASAGFGTHLFDDLCVDWSREQVGDQVVVTASIPLAIG
jgi:signal transduction histidine kinase